MYLWKHLASIIDNSTITRDKVIHTTKTIPTNFREKSWPLKQKILYLLTFLLITIALLIAVRTYCYLIKYQAKQKQMSQTTNYKKLYINKYIINMEINDKLKEINIKTST